ncbi:RcnB family protein [Parasphingorhabdus sp. JC815]
MTAIASDYQVSDNPRDYRWVWSGNDAVLIDISSGITGAVM